MKLYKNQLYECYECGMIYSEEDLDRFLPVGKALKCPHCGNPHDESHQIDENEKEDLIAEGILK